MKKILYIVTIIIVIIPKIVYADDEIDTSEIISNQEQSFNIRNFLSQAKEYAPDFMGETDVSDIYNSAMSGEIDNVNLLKKAIKLLGSSVTDTLKILINILVIVLIHSILKSITDSLEGSNVSKIIYYVEYILIVTVIMSNFSDILNSITNTIDNLVGFTNLLIPLLVSLMIYTGSIATSSVIEPILLFLIEFIGNVISRLIVPVVSIITVLIIVSKITNRVQITKLSNFMKSSIVWFLGIILTVFVGVMSLEGTLTSSVDGITAKTTKAAVSTVIPVVGKILADSVDTVLGCGIVLKNAIGIVGVLIIIGICLMPIIKLATFSIMYSLTASIIEPLADCQIVKLLEDMNGIFKLLLAILCSVSVMLIVGVTLVIKISNSGMMYR